MNATTVTCRTLAATVATGALFALAVPGAIAGPVREPAGSTKASCPVGMDGLAARLRAAGLTAQAANIATHLTYRDCLDARVAGR
jgi:hypothetical protein